MAAAVSFIHLSSSPTSVSTPPMAPGEDNRAYGIYSGSELTIVPTQRSVGCKRSQTTWRKENVNIRRKSFGMILVTGCFLPIAASAQDMSIKSAEVSEGARIKQ